MKNKIDETTLKEIFPKKLKRAKASQQVYTQLKNMILTGKLKEGERLIEEQIALSFNVSRTVVGEVFGRLKKEKMIIKKFKKGAFVTYKP